MPPPAVAAHPHAHAHGHDGHSHAHEAPALGATHARRVEPAFSLLRLSAWARVGLAAALVAPIWAGVWWALT